MLKVWTDMQVVHQILLQQLNILVTKVYLNQARQTFRQILQKGLEVYKDK